MKIALTTTTPEVRAEIPVSLLEGPFSSRIEKTARLGYDGIEIMVTQPDQIDADALSVQIRQHGLEIAAVSTGALAFLEKLTLLSTDAAIRDQAFQRLIDLIMFASRVGAPFVTIGSFRGRSAGEERKDRFNQLAEILHQAACIAAQKNVRLVIEPLNRYEADLILNTEEALAFIEIVGHTHLGILLDTFHINIEEASLTECICQAAAAGRLWHVHLGDSNRLSPGRGHLDFPTVFNTLKTVGYSGFCSAELLSRPTPQITATQTIEYCQPCMA